MASREQELQEKTSQKLKETGFSKRELLAFSNLFRKMYNDFCRPCQVHYITTVSGSDTALKSLDVAQWSGKLCAGCKCKFDEKYLKRLERFTK